VTGPHNHFYVSKGQPRARLGTEIRRACAELIHARCARRQGETRTYPVLPLRDIVVFPHMIVPLFVGREKSIKARWKR
jgi:hypothetical protein